MIPELCVGFEQFASAFVHAYWSTVKDRTFPMPPDEPVEESLEEILSAVKYSTKRKRSLTKRQREYEIRMKGEMGAWWHFGFRHEAGAWRLVYAKANSYKKFSPHDLLDSVYGPHFRPFLNHVTSEANRNSEQGGGHKD
ncbi:hypothetical protein OAF33_01970 [bacterium]|nr:hypothetical protein [bacterium]